MWNLPGPEIKPVSPSLAGRFFTTKPPGKPSSTFCIYFLHLGFCKSENLASTISSSSFFFFPFIFISWRLLLYTVVVVFAIHWHKSAMDLHVFPIPNPPSPPSPSHPSGSSQCTSPEHLSHASNLDWRSVSHLIIYMFRCCSLRSSHPCLLP